MRPVLRPWVLLLVGAIIVVALMIWTRANPREPDDPLARATATISKGLGLDLEPRVDSQGGLLINKVRAQSPGEFLGLRRGDRIMAVGDRSVWHAHSFASQISERMSNNMPAPILVKRGDEYFSVVLGRSRSVQGSGGIEGPAGRRGGAGRGRPGP